MPKTLADASIKLTGTTTAPEDAVAASLTDLNGASAVDLMCGINKADYQLGATGNATVTEQEACKQGEGNAPGPATYAGSITPFWYLDEDRKPVEEEMEVWDFVKTPNATLHLFEREGKLATAPWEAGDEYDYYEVITGTPQPPSDRQSGYIKRVVPLHVQNHVRGVVSA